MPTAYVSGHKVVTNWIPMRRREDENYEVKNDSVKCRIDL
jgi:hypothetical protein